MIRILLFFVLLFYPSISWGETKDDLVHRDWVYYKKFSDVPFTGEVTGEWNGLFKNGKEEGYWVTYWSNGQLMSKGVYKTGKRVGEWLGFKPDGTVLEPLTGTFKNGVKVSD